MKLLRVEPVDPVMTRDGRPFGDTPGATAYIMDSITPGVVAGTIRMLLVKEWLGEGRTRPLSEAAKHFLKQTRIAGPLLEWKDHIYYPMPKDLLFYEEQGKLKAEALRPQKLNPGEGYFGVSVEGRLSDSLHPVDVPHSGKPYANSPAFLREDWLHRWLKGTISADEWVSVLNTWDEWLTYSGKEAAPPDSPFLRPYEQEARVHNAIDATTGRVEEGKLFSTAALRFYPGVALLAGVMMENESEGSGRLAAVHSMGGKRRLSYFQEMDWPGERPFPWTCPEDVAHSLREARPGDMLRMTLATPAYFDKGWRPRWVDAQFRTTKEFHELWNLPDSVEELKLELVWACTDRWQPISGWNYSRTQQEGREKPVRRMVPAGSVYFFKIIAGDAGILAEHWLDSVSDTTRREGPLDKEDGFGMAMWGVESKREDVK
ncbi:CRISPR-associated protein Cmr3 [Paenibacillus forsythiae]|uniref:CRISPR-associated protein Cmr3 n=1 Tax=Paenibacillus forsythiae TaxID=365616 RepID=A0ABU3H903_9BACL|nr:type III-B CRISPR module-associated protein Cmr3 [Paenibacillus forsythiae]MDT3426165.1 CRISPR-associated protein Cmr3 [Paenibacillus forsythiae]